MQNKSQLILIFKLLYIWTRNMFVRPEIHNFYNVCPYSLSHIHIISSLRRFQVLPKFLVTLVTSLVLKLVQQSQLPGNVLFSWQHLDFLWTDFPESLSTETLWSCIPFLLPKKASTHPYSKYNHMVVDLWDYISVTFLLVVLCDKSNGMSLCSIGQFSLCAAGMQMDESRLL